MVSLPFLVAVLSIIISGLASAASKSDATYAWHAIGGSNNPDTDDTGHGVAVDSAGNIYVTGHSGTSWNGPSGQSPLHAHSGVGDTFIMKLTSSGFYQWHTFYPSHGDDTVSSIALDAGGNIYASWVTVGAPWSGPGGQAPMSTIDDMTAALTVLKLDNNGGYKWHTFYGAHNGGIWAHGIAAGNNNDVYVLGTTDGDWGNGHSPLHAFSGGSTDQVILKLDRDGKYQWHTFYGSGVSGSGYGREDGHGIVVDANSNVYITATNPATWNGPNGQAPVNAFEIGGTNILILKLNSSGSYQWHTFNGTYSEESDMDNSIAIDGSGNLYVTGYNNVDEGYWKGPHGEEPLHLMDGHGMFILKLNGSGSYQWHTFYPGEYPGYSIASDGAGDVFIAGHTIGTWNGPNGEAPLHDKNGDENIILLKLTTDGAYQWHTFYGANSSAAYAVASDKWGDISVTGMTDTTWTGPNGESPLHDYSGGSSDFFVLKVINCAASVNFADLTVHVPAVSIGNNLYWGDLQLVPASGSFNVTAVAVVSDPGDFAKCAPSTLSTEDGNLFLNVPDILLNGASLWGKFLYTGGISFSLTGAGLN